MARHGCPSICVAVQECVIYGSPKLTEKKEFQYPEISSWVKKRCNISCLSDLQHNFIQLRLLVGSQMQKPFSSGVVL